MSGKIFKRARKLARKVTAGQKPNQLVGREHTVKKHGNTYNRIQALNAAGTTRAVYREIKGLLRRGHTIAHLEESILAKLQSRAVADAPPA